MKIWTNQLPFPRSFLGNIISHPPERWGDCRLKFVLRADLGMTNFFSLGSQRSGKLGLSHRGTINPQCPVYLI